MNQELEKFEAKFCITAVEEGISMEIEGSGKDLINLLANTISESEEVEEVITMALIAVHMKRESESNEGNDLLNSLFSKVRPKAQA